MAAHSRATARTPPPNIPAVEPDVRGTKNIREQLDKHRSDKMRVVSRQDRSTGSPWNLRCHRRFPHKLSLDRAKATCPRGSIDPIIGIGFKLGPAVDASGNLSDQRAFKASAILKRCSPPTPPSC